MMQRIKWLIVMLFFFYMNVSASGEVALNLECKTLDLIKGEKAVCELMVNTIDNVSIHNISFQIEKDNDYSLTFTGKNGFKGSIIDNKLILNNTTAHNGKIAIGTLSISLEDNASYDDKRLVLKDISFSNSSDLTKIYTSNNITKTFKVLSDDNSLKYIKVDGVSLNKFNPLVLEYSIDVNGENINIVSESNYEKALVKGNGIYKLEYGLNKIEIKVTSESNKEKTYKLNINRIDNRSKVNTLKSLKIEGINLNFKSTNNTYKINVKGHIDSIKIDSTLMDEKASYVDGFGNREVNLNYGNNEVLIKVLAENGKENVYTLNIVREDIRSDSAVLNNLVINGNNIELKDNIFEYNLSLYYKHSKTQVLVNTSALSKVEYKDIDLKVGKNILIIKVTSEKGTTNEYKINIERLSQENSKIAINDIIVDGYKLNFSKNIMEYNLKIDKDTDTLNISILPDEEEITYTIVGNNNLKNGSKISINIKDDLGEYIYTINIIKEVNEKLIWGFLNINQICYIVFFLGFMSFLCSIIKLLMVKKVK